MSDPIVSPDGRSWQVRRRWAPRLGAESLVGRIRRRIQGVRHGARRLSDTADPPGGCLPLGLDDVVITLALVAVVAMLALVVVPLLVALIDALVVVLLAVLGTVLRVVFRRPWVVEATSPGGDTHHWRVVGWRRSGEHRDHVAQLLAAGAELPPEGDRLPPADRPAGRPPP